MCKHQSFLKVVIVQMTLWDTKVKVFSESTDVVARVWQSYLTQDEKFEKQQTNLFRGSRVTARV